MVFCTGLKCYKYLVTVSPWSPHLIMLRCAPEAIRELGALGCTSRIPEWSQVRYDEVVLVVAEGDVFAIRPEATGLLPHSSRAPWC